MLEAMFWHLKKLMIVKEKKCCKNFKEKVNGELLKVWLDKI